MMNANIDRLYKIGLKPSRLIIGLMSGTSVDGLDIALCRCFGSGPNTKIEIIQFNSLTTNFFVFYPTLVCKNHTYYIGYTKSTQGKKDCVSRENVHFYF